jgi:hypothetical protein
MSSNFEELGYEYGQFIFNMGDVFYYYLLLPFMILVLSIELWILREAFGSYCCVPVQKILKSKLVSLVFNGIIMIIF